MSRRPNSKDKDVKNGINFAEWLFVKSVADAWTIASG